MSPRGNLPAQDLPSLDDVDRQILRALQEDGKLSIKELAAQLELSKTPVYERIRRLEQEGVIRGYVALVDKNLFPPRMTAFCSVNLKRQETKFVDAFVESASGRPEVLDIHVIGGEFDLLLRVVCDDLQAYYAFVTGVIAALPNVANTRSFFVIDEAKSSTRWPV